MKNLDSVWVTDGKMPGVPNFDWAFVELNRRIAENLKAAMANRPEAAHGAAGSTSWSGCVGRTVSGSDPVSLTTGGEVDMRFLRSARGVSSGMMICEKNGGLSCAA
jgi:hypothetical protein